MVERQGIKGGCSGENRAGGRALQGCGALLGAGWQTAAETIGKCFPKIRSFARLFRFIHFIPTPAIHQKGRPKCRKIKGSSKTVHIVSTVLSTFGLRFFQKTKTPSKMKIRMDMYIIAQGTGKEKKILPAPCAMAAGWPYYAFDFIISRASSSASGVSERQTLSSTSPSAVMVTKRKTVVYCTPVMGTENRYCVVLPIHLQK